MIDEVPSLFALAAAETLSHALLGDNEAVLKARNVLGELLDDGGPLRFFMPAR